MFTGINHVSIVTSDISRAVRVWADRYGVGPWRVYSYGPETMDIRLDGEPAEFQMRVALCRLSPSTRIEIVQPLDDRSPYARSLAEHGGADHVHHMRLDVADYRDSLARLHGFGLTDVLSGRFQGRDPNTASSATYLHTEADLGVIVELAELPADYEPPEPDYTYPEEHPR
jgi:catechol 2,3-dioxygenase-like lactoylglutathione lyase family enzyme